MTKIIVAFRNFSNAPKNVSGTESVCILRSKCLESHSVSFLGVKNLISLITRVTITCMFLTSLFAKTQNGPEDDLNVSRNMLRYALKL
jgi:hypothetical protein